MTKLLVNFITKFPLKTNRVHHGALLYWSVLFSISTVIMHGIGLVKQPPHSGLVVAILLILTVLQALTIVSVVWVPSRRLLFGAGAIQTIALLLWIVAHTLGLPGPSTLWRPETLGVPDLYLPVEEGISAFFFLCLFGRTWTTAPRAVRIALAWLPSMFIVFLLIWGVVFHSLVSELVLVTFLLDAQIPTSLEFIFLPIVCGLVAFLLLRLSLKNLRVRTKGALKTCLTLIPAFLVITLVNAGGDMNASHAAWLPISLPVQAPAGQTTTLSYGRVGDSPLAIDITEPSTQASRPAPVVMWIHGGETLQGSRALQDGSKDGMYLTQLRTELVTRGFVVCSIDYGLSPLYHASDEIREAKEAVRFLRAHSCELGIDPQRIGVYGFSEGGYISAMVGNVGPGTFYDAGQYLNQSSRVEAVVDISGLTDLTNFSGSPSWVHSLGGGGTRAQLNAASPVTYVKPGNPPFLIIHGTNDWFIAPHHSINMAKLLRANGDSVKLVLIKNDGHGIDAPTAGRVEQPSPDETVQIIANFFTRTLAQ